ncbi:UPF0509 protein [Salmonella enterica subsp. enterica serovar Choleraesuis]|nr:UPF0509 protein [Salmonella enterica subsp. enterica serovar Choleraesuis]
MQQSSQKLLMQRIDTIIDILVAGDTRSAIHNLEILKAELIAIQQVEEDAGTVEPVRPPWEI